MMKPSTSWDPQTYARNARFVSDLGEPLLQLLKAQPGELILDLGCGDGALTEKITGSGCTVIGVDSSLPQLEAARERGLNVVAMDGCQLGFQRRFDAVFTNAALHWMKQAEAVAAGVANSLKSGGRYVGEFGGDGNVEIIRSALHAALRRRAIDPSLIDPWYYPSPEQYSELLSKTGFIVSYMELVPRPTKLPGDMLGWLQVFAQPFIQPVVEAQRTSFLEEVRNELATSLRDRKGNWYADYVRLRFKATK
jgi:trans-aconitate methyltransferase